MPTDEEEDDGGSQHPFNDTGPPPRSPTGRARDSAARDSAREAANPTPNVANHAHVVANFTP